MGEIVPFRRPDVSFSIAFIGVWSGISKESQAPIHGADYVFSDGSHAIIGWWPNLAQALAQAHEAAADASCRVVEIEP